MFPGNLQGRTVRETGPKGCVLVTVDDDHGVDVQFRAVDVLRWEVCRVDVRKAKQPDDVVQNVGQSLAGLIDASDNRPLAVRIELEGACPAHRQLVAEPNRWSAEIQAAALHLGSDRLWIERVVRKTSMPSSKDSLADIEGPVGELCEFIAEMQSEKQSLEMLSEALRPLLSKLPAELTEGPSSLGLDSEECLRELLDDARQLLIQRIHVAGETA
jgi:DNA repair exonuclease SbcCD nuclease subunit